jgi:hypothetical protein
MTNVNDEMVWFVYKTILPAAFGLLPGQMSSREASAELLTIGLQESRFRYRKQIQGPAHGFWQFEEHGGIEGVLTHVSTRPVLLPILTTLNYKPNVRECYNAIVDNDVLAAIFARLLLWTVPGNLPRQNEPQKGWAQYREGWRPGKPHPETWDSLYSYAWSVVGR